MKKRISYNLLIIFIVGFIYYSCFYNMFALSIVEGTVTEELGSGQGTAPVPGVLVKLIEENGNAWLAYSQADGKFIFNGVPAGTYDLQYRYGDLEIIDDNPEQHLTPEQVLKYNGQDYIATHMNGVTEELAEQVIPQIGPTAAQVFLVVDNSGSMQLPVNFVDIRSIKPIQVQPNKTTLQPDPNKTNIVPINTRNITQQNIVPDQNTPEPNKSQELTTKDIDVHWKDQDYNWPTTIPISSVSPLGSTVASPLNNGISRMEEVKEASKVLIDKIIEQDENIYCGLINFNTTPTLLSQLCRDQDYLKSCVDSLKPDGTTEVRVALQLARNSFVDNDGAKIIIFLSDGEPTDVDIGALKNEIATIRSEGIELFSLIIEDDVDNNRIRDIFGESPSGSSVLAFRKSGDELADCITDYLPNWIIQMVEEIREQIGNVEQVFDVQYGGQVGIEDEDRRSIVDSSFSNVFHYNNAINSSDIAGRMRLFKALDDSSGFTDKELSEFSEATYMTVTYKDFVVKEETKIANLNLRLKRREPFNMQVSTKAVAMRITLSDGTVLVNDINDSESFHMFYTSLDEDLVRGSTVEIEYKVSVTNNSNTMACTQLQLLSYLPEGLTINSHQELLSNPKKTNYSNGWHLTDKDVLYKNGTISDELYESDLMNRSIAMFYGDTNSGVNIKPHQTFVTRFVTSMCIGEAYQIEYNHLNAVEIAGYRNTQYRRMEDYSTDLQTNKQGATKAFNSGYISVYPGDGKADDIDYATDTNKEFVLPPTGSKNYYPVHILIIMALISLSLYFIIKKQALK